MLLTKFPNFNGCGLRAFEGLVWGFYAGFSSDLECLVEVGGPKAIVFAVGSRCSKVNQRSPKSAAV